MRQRIQRMCAVLLSVALALSLGPWALADFPADKRDGVEGSYTGKTVILHSNDVHGEIMGYAYMAALRNQFEEKGAEVLLADAGDFSQGDPNVSLSKGLDAVVMMNAAGYDVATLGNHEFDFGFQTLMDNLAEAEFQAICADVYEDGEPILPPAWTYEDEESGLKIGFFGMETPETQTKVNPGLIQGIQFASNTGGTALYACAQEQIDALRGGGADIVIALAHLGVDDESAPDGHRSVDLYQNTTGIDLILDGHSHTVMTAGEKGEPIQSTGTKFQNIGVVVIDNESKAIEDRYLIPLKETVEEDGKQVERFIPDLSRDPEVAEMAQSVIDSVNAAYGDVFAQSEILLDGAKAPGNRTQETNLGDLITDAMVWKVLDENRDEDGTASLTMGSVTVDEAHVVGVTNGGGIRAGIQAGDVTRKDLNTVLPFGNTVAVVFVTGAELLEALEASTYSTPDALGGYPQTFGIQFTLDTTKAYDKGEAYPDSTYYCPASIQRVNITSINGEPFDTAATYAVVTNNFCAAGGDTYYVFKNASAQFDTGIVMDEAVMEYVSDKLGGYITSEDYGGTRHDQIQVMALPETGDLFADVPATGVYSRLALSGDLTLTEAAHVGDGQLVTLDLAGHTLTAPKGTGFVVDGGSLIITDSTGNEVITERGSITAASGVDALITQNGGNVSIMGVSLYTEDGACVRVTGPAEPNEDGTAMEKPQLVVVAGAGLTAKYQNAAQNRGEQAAVSVEGPVDFLMDFGYIDVTNGTGVFLRESGGGFPTLTMTKGVVHAGSGDDKGVVTGVCAVGAAVTVKEGSILDAEGRSSTVVYYEGCQDSAAGSLSWNSPTLNISGGSYLQSYQSTEAVGLHIVGGNGFVSNAVIGAEAEQSAVAVRSDDSFLYIRDSEESEEVTQVTAESGTGEADAVRATASGSGESTPVTVANGVFTGNVYAERNGQTVKDNTLLSLAGGRYSVRPDEAYLSQLTAEDGQVYDVYQLAANPDKDGFYRVEDKGIMHTLSYHYYYENTHDAYNSMTGIQSVVQGTKVTVSVKDVSGPITGSWTVEDGAELQIVEGSLTEPSITFIMPDRDVSLEGNFREGTDEYEGKTVILHSNDVHGEITGYAYMAALRDQFEYGGASVLLVDAGDFSQGDPNVSLSKGADAVAMMNATGYHIATLGNHEFDYGYEQLKDNVFDAQFSVICADVYEGDTPILAPAIPISIGEEDDSLTIGFFGLETPETQTKVNPGLIQGLRFVSNTGTDNRALYTCAQEQIDALRETGADIVIGLTHLGVDEESAPDGHRSVDLYENTTGIDLILDGHSHTVMTCWADGKPYNPFAADAVEPGGKVIPIQSTGTKFQNIGLVVIDNESKAIEDHYLVPLKETVEIDGKNVERFIPDLEQDPDVAARAQEIMDRVDAEYGEVFAHSEILLNGDKAPGNRTEETNLGDLITDAMVWKVLEANKGEDGTASLTIGTVTVDEDHVVGITNGGGIRASIQPGDVTRKDLNTVLPFGNTVSVVFVTGAELLEALEASTYATPEALGGYPQTFGIEFSLDTSKAYDKGEAYPDSTYYRPGSIQRVTVTAVNGEPFDQAETYAVVTNNFCAAGGDTYYVFKNASAQFDTGIVMDEAVMEYVEDALGGVISRETYGEPRGDQRIVSGENPSTPDTTGTSGTAKQGCYVATSVYGSYDCPEVWTLRRYRDEVLGSTWYGRLFIRAYYAVSPTAVKFFGDSEWFQQFFHARLNQMVSSLQAHGFASTSYQDRAW